MNTLRHTCALCGRSVPTVTKHHLIPRTRHANKKTRREHDRDERQQTVDLCAPCHKQIHALLTEKQLEREYHTLTALAAHPQIATFVTWLKTKPGDTHVPVHRRR